jgi:hypothetical protein
MLMLKLRIDPRDGGRWADEKSAYEIDSCFAAKHESKKRTGSSAYRTHGTVDYYIHTKTKHRFCLLL